MPSTSLHRPVPPFYTARPKPSHHSSVSGFWPKPHPPASRWRTRSPHPCRCLISPCPPPLCIAPYRRFTRHARNRAITARFRGFGPNPTPPPRVGERAAPTPVVVLSAHARHLSALCRTAILHGTPKTEPSQLGFGVLAQTPLPRLALANMQPPPLPLSYQPVPATSLHRSVPPFYTARLKPSHHSSVSGFWLKPHSPASCWRTRSPHPCRCLISPCPPPLCIVPYRRFTRHSQNRATTARFRGFGSNPTPPPRLANAQPLPLSMSYQPMPATSLHHPVLPFFTAHLKPSCCAWFSYFRPSHH
jgi:hypothetical protein